MNKIKILMVGRYPLNEKIHGGTMVHTYHLANHVANSKDIELHIINFSSINNKYINKNNINLHYIKKHSLRYLRPLDIIKLTRSISEINPDIVHIQCSKLPNSIICELVRRKYPTLLTIHGLTKNEVSFQRGMNYLIERFVGIPIENHILSRLANIIVVTPYDKKFIPNTKANIHTISNGIQNEYFNIKDNKKPNNLLFVGGIAPRKGILDLLKAMKIIIKKNNQVKLNIVGGIVSKEYFEIIHRYVKDNGLQEHVNYTGYLNDQDLREKYSECEIFVFPSHEESQGIVLLEAMACGKAIVASNIGGIPYVIKNEKTGLLFECGNIEELADKIITLLTNKELNEYIKINCVKDAIKYKWPKIAEQTIKVYKELYEDNQKY